MSLVYYGLLEFAWSVFCATDLIDGHTCRYLDRHKVTEGEEKKFVYEWGARAKEELNPKEVLMFVSNVHGMDIEVWMKQYEHQLQGENK
jgi:hypothetical protein